MKITKVSLSIVSSIVVFSFLVYFAGCDNSVTTSGSLSTHPQARTERDFVLNSGLRAAPDAVVLDILEDLNAPSDTANMDTGTIGEDIILYNFPAPKLCSFTLQVNPSFKVRLVNESSGGILFELLPSSLSTEITVPAGNYKLYITSLKEYVTGTAASQSVFIQQQTDALDSSKLKIFLMTGQCQGCRLDGVNLSNMDLTNVILDRSVLTGADLSYSNVTGSSFKECTFTFANLNHSFGHYAYFDGAKCKGANFTRAALTICHFRNAYLVEANFTNADIGASDCRGANFCGAIKTGIDAAGILVDGTTGCWP